ncbi:MAG: RNA polymerase subunit sigma [Saprospiraceae bacterium]|nr:RNA polymerase subunit sigma [Saprospiraceae bacterium]
MEAALIPHLFRTEFAKISALLCNKFGVEFMANADDITSDTFVAALESWPYNGVPHNPAGWLYKVAINKALNLINRNKHWKEKGRAELMTVPQVDEQEQDLSQLISDSQLQMIFVCCHPCNPPEAQIALALRTLCGFGIDEIATAFITNKEVINKRLYRARLQLREAGQHLALPDDAALGSRIDNVLTTLYLLYSEGYYSEHHPDVIREDLCREAMRLNQMLIEAFNDQYPQVKALMALMHFQYARIKARTGRMGELILYKDQDINQWDTFYISEGSRLLRQSSTGDAYSRFHLEAAIASMYCQPDPSPAKWTTILHLYDLLYQLMPSDLILLNKMYAYARVHGNDAALIQLSHYNIPDSQFKWALLGNLYFDSDVAKSMVCFQKAIKLAKTDKEKKLLDSVIKDLYSI